MLDGFTASAPQLYQTLFRCTYSANPFDLGLMVANITVQLRELLAEVDLLDYATRGIPNSANLTQIAPIVRLPGHHPS